MGVATGLRVYVTWSQFFQGDRRPSGFSLLIESLLLVERFALFLETCSRY